MPKKRETQQDKQNLRDSLRKARIFILYILSILSMPELVSMILSRVLR